MSLGLKPILSENPKVLILGSMPSQKSIEKQEYYGNPQNKFWKIMSQYFGFPCEDPYAIRKSFLMKEELIVWDTIYSCFRPGSMDSDIDLKSVKVNDFKKLFKQYETLKVVFFNGAASKKIFFKNKLNLLLEDHQLDFKVLPSTSPAYASMTYQDKYQKWSEALSAYMVGNKKKAFSRK